MTAEQVIKLGQEITKPDLGWFHLFNTEITLVILALVALGAGLIIWGAKAFFGEKRAIGGFILIFIAFCMFLLVGYASNIKEDEIYDKEIKEWKENYAKPYIESIHKEKKEIVYIKIDSELSHDTKGTYSWGTGYTYSKAVKLTPLTISFKGNGLETETNWYSTHMNLTSEEKPYLEYNYLKQDLGHGIKKGRYNKEIYLPDTYKFTDIK
ncbi:hypothetical protein [Priestia megaterium]|uniref:hypothetical protein n=1 Tax=Priestia megaterium TaxID=1404 RepID=UPI00287777FF|nr:hypothetical protein [Priestia megaterium]